MKKLMMSLLVGVLALGAFGDQFVSRAYQPDTNNVATITQDFATVATPVLIYTELTGTTSNAVVLTFVPDLSTNATDYGVSYRIGSFTTPGGTEVPIVLNTPEDSNSIATGPLNRSGAVVLTGAGGTESTNVLYRVVFKIE